MAHKLNMKKRYSDVKLLEEKDDIDMIIDCDLKRSPLSSAGSTPNRSICGTPMTISTPSSTTSSPLPSPVERKTSLGAACQKFLMLFLVVPEVIKLTLLSILDLHARLVCDLNSIGDA